MALLTGDRIEINAVPTGERLVEPFEVADGVTIAPGAYKWMRYRLEAGTAQKRRFHTQVSWWFGEFYGGTLDQIEVEATGIPRSLVTIELSTERNIGHLPEGDFAVDSVGHPAARQPVSPDLSLAGYVQYDTESNSIGVNTRLRWTFRPVADLFVVYNHNVRLFEQAGGRMQSNELIVGVQLQAWRR